MTTPAVATMTERERAALEVGLRLLDMLQRKPMGTAPEPQPATKVIPIERKHA